jgi:hypothetical protein
MAATQIWPVVSSEKLECSRSTTVEAGGLGDMGDLDAANEPHRHRRDDFAAGKLVLDMIAQ